MLNINRRIQVARAKNPEVMQGVVRPEIVNGQLYWHAVDSAERFEDISEAVAYQKAQGMTVAQVGSEYTDIRVPRQVRELDDYLKSQGARVERYNYNLADDYQLAQFEKKYQRNDKFYGWLVDDDKSNTYLRAWNADGTEMTHFEISEILKRKFGLVTEDPLSTKLSKRKKAYATAKEYEAYTDPIRIGLIDVAERLDLGDYRTYWQNFASRNPDAIPEIMAKTNEELRKKNRPLISSLEELINFKMREAVDIAADGFSVGSMEFAGKVIDEQTLLAKRLAKEATAAETAGNMSAARQLRTDAEFMQRKVKELTEAVEQGSVFNIRTGGYLGAADDSELVERALERLDNVGIQLKGNIIFDPTGWVHSRGFDVITHAENITNEFGFTVSVMDDPSQARALTTLTAHRHSYETILDIQTMASNPEIFTREMLKDMSQTRMQDTRAAIESAAKGKGIPPAFRATLESMADGDLDNAANPELMRRARNILRVIDSGFAIEDDAYIMSELIDLMEKASFRTKSGFDMPKMAIPNAQRGELIPRYGAEMAGIDVRGIGPGQPIWDERSGSWVMHEAQGVLRHSSLGGFDWDDAMIGMYRYDQESRTVRMIGIRQPNARYEQLSATLAQSNPLVMKAVADAQKEDTYQNALKKIRQLKSVNRKMEQELSEWGNVAENPRRAKRVNKFIRSLQDHRRKIQHNEQEIAKLESLVDEVLTEAVGSYKDISRTSGGIIGQPIPINMIDPSTSQTVAGIAYEGEDGRVLMSYAKPPSNPAAFEDMLNQQMKDLGVKAFRDLDPNNEAHAALYNKILEQKFKSIDPKARHAIGIWSNPRMILDTWWGTNESLLLENPLLEKEFRQRAYAILMEQEAVIDTMRDMDALRARTEDMISLMYEMTARYQAEGTKVQIDPALIRIKGGGTSRARDIGLAAAKKITGKTLTDDDILMKANDDRAVFSMLEQIADFYTESFEEERAARAVWGDVITKDDTLRTPGTTRDATKMLQAFDVRGLSEATDPMEINQIWSQASQGMLDYLTTTFEDGQATERTYRTILRAAQMSGGKSKYKFAALEQVWNDGTLMTNAINWLYNDQITSGRVQPAIENADDILAQIKNIEGLLADPNVPDLIGPELPGQAGAVKPVLRRQIQKLKDELDPRRVVGNITLRDVEEALGSVSSSRVQDIIGNLLDSDMSREMLNDINQGMARAGTDGVIQVPTSVQAGLVNTPDDVARVVPSKGELPGVFSPNLVIRRRSGEEDTLGRLLYQADGMTGGTQSAIQEEVVEALTGFRDVLFDSADAKDLPPTLRNRVIRAMERSPDVPGAEKLNQAREAAEIAAKIVEQKNMAKGGFFSKMVGTTGGKLGIIGAAAFATLGLSRIVRNKDATVNDMQGPAFMPGGNPYQDDPNAHGSQNVNGFSLNPPARSPADSGGGITYQVRTRGGNYDSDFIDQIGNITGGNITGTTYDAELPFRSEDARQRILESYS